MPPNVMLRFIVETSDFPRLVATADSLLERLPAEDDEEIVHRVIRTQVIEAISLFERSRDAGLIVVNENIIQDM